jgi:hypothetical protein
MHIAAFGVTAWESGEIADLPIPLSDYAPLLTFRVPDQRHRIAISTSAIRQGPIALAGRSIKKRTSSEGQRGA